jgi:hypothetical protein
MPRHVLPFAVAVILILVTGCSSEKPDSDATAKSATNSDVTAVQPDTTSAAPEKPAADPASPPAVRPAEKPAEGKAETLDLPKELLPLFKQLDELGRDKVKDAKFVTVTIMYAGLSNGQEYSADAWLVAEDDKTVTLLKEDLIPWVYNRKGATSVPERSERTFVILKSVKDADFESVCKAMSQAEKVPDNEEEQFRRRVNALHGPGPSHRLLVAHAAWKKGLTRYPPQIVALDPIFAEDKDKYRQAVLDDLGWLHFLRGVNLLTFADRKEVLPHLRLAAKLSPHFEFGTDVNDLAARLEALVAESEKEQPAKNSETGLSAAEKAELYVSQLKDLHCVQMSQPGSIMPYGLSDGILGQRLASKKLKDLGLVAVPALINALEDDTPTRTVYYWRDFHHSRVVWRVSDFAWTILRDITQKDFGERPIVGFTFSYMNPQEKRAVMADVKTWYAQSKNSSPDDRMLGFFNSEKPDDWMTAGQYFLKKKDNRAVAPLLQKIAGAGQFRAGDLCELVAKFGDPRAIPAVLDVLENADEASDRIHAAIALWELGDKSGVAVAIEYVTAEKQPYGSWDDPVWFLVLSHTPEGIEALKSVVLDGPVPRAAEVLGFIQVAITGNLWGKAREPAACAEVCPLLISAMERADLTGGSINDVKTRIKDSAAKSLVILRQGWDARLGGRFVQIDTKLFNELEPDETKRDEQIEGLKKWYGENKDKLIWDAKAKKLLVKSAE